MSLVLARAEIESVTAEDIGELLAAAYSASTLRNYDRAARAFLTFLTGNDWRRAQSSPIDLALPARAINRYDDNELSVAAAKWVSRLTDAGKAVSTIDQAVAALAACCAIVGRPTNPFNHPSLQRVRAGSRRLIGVAAKRKARALTPSELRSLILAAGDARHPVIAARDRAVISLIVFSGGRRVSEVLGLRNEDVHIRQDPFQDGRELVELFIRGSKTDRTKVGATKFAPDHDDLIICPVHAMRAWRTHRGMTPGPLFPSRGRTSSAALTRDGFARSLRKAARVAGVDPLNLSTHSFRATFATLARLNGAALEQIAEMMGHASLNSTRGYIRDLDSARTARAVKVI